LKRLFTAANLIRLFWWGGCGRSIDKRRLVRHRGSSDSDQGGGNLANMKAHCNYQCNNLMTSSNHIRYTRPQILSMRGIDFLTWRRLWKHPKVSTSIGKGGEPLLERASWIVVLVALVVQELISELLQTNKISITSNLSE
jgi:hypothetical protein